MNEDTRHLIPRSVSAHSIGLVLGPIMSLSVYHALGNAETLSFEGRKLAAAATLMAIWWVFEAIPLAATALLPVVLFPTLGVLEISETTARYADKLIFLFMGGLMLGVGLQRWDAHKRLALLIILLVGTGPRRIVAGIMLSSGVLSAFISNTAASMMMLPIVLAVGILTVGDERKTAQGERYFVCLLLALAYGANIGGLATITGTPPNGLLAGFLTKEMNIEMTYARWLSFGVPLTAVLLPVAWFYLVFVATPVRIRGAEGGRRFMRERLAELGPITRAEVIALSIFALTAILWIFHGYLESAHGFPKMNDAAIAIGGALLMFAIPSGNEEKPRILSWKDAETIPWGILLLFGGGLALAKGVTSTGLDSWLGSQISQMGQPGELPLIAGVSVLVVFLTQITSNTATTSTMLPVLAAVSEGLGVNAVPLLIAAAVSASCAFMLPVATPPNAIVFSSGRISIRQMAVAGFGLNIIAIILVTLMVWLFSGPLLGL